QPDPVIGLRFAYDATTVDLLKLGLKPLHAQVRDRPRHIHYAGGWLPEARAWFIEWAAWPDIEPLLTRRLGHTLVWTDRPPDVPHYAPLEPEPEPEPEPGPAPAPEQEPVPAGHSVRDCLAVCAQAYPHHRGIGLWPGVPRVLVESAYRSLAKLVHPDVRG